MRTTTNRTLGRKMLVLIGAAALVAATLACGGDEATDSTAATSIPETSAGVTGDPVAATGDSGTVKDLEYLSTGEDSLPIDVYRPDGDGPFPVIVVFHGNGGSGKDSPYTRRAASALAESGLVVFAPTWSGFPTPTADGWLGDVDRASCALAYAEEHAAEYGGNPDALATFGWSAGAHPAAWLALGHGSPGAGCVVETDPTVPNGAVLIDSEYFLHSNYFDPMFEDEGDATRSIVAGFIDPTAWATADQATFRLVAAETQGTYVRSIDDPTDPGGWLAQRDADGSLTADLERLGALDDGQIDYIDEAELLQLRLEGAGIDATFTTASGDHSDTVGAVNDAILIPAALEATGSG